MRLAILLCGCLAIALGHEGSDVSEVPKDPVEVCSEHDDADDAALFQSIGGPPMARLPRSTSPGSKHRRKHVVVKKVLQAHRGKHSLQRAHHGMMVSGPPVWR
ncbi:unnamed protein product [Symbiodinium natans]|uniref:Secreted protein n=1 Tax=Symbiodinium natans TaxID=878477 RepID=A0A812M7K7_9DINO|nr:unnamed protein product [Symbiodinium natans]